MAFYNKLDTTLDNREFLCYDEPSSVGSSNQFREAREEQEMILTTKQLRHLAAILQAEEARLERAGRMETGAAKSVASIAAMVERELIQARQITPTRLAEIRANEAAIARAKRGQRATSDDPTVSIATALGIPYGAPGYAEALKAKLRKEREEAERAKREANPPIYLSNADSPETVLALLGLLD